MPRNPASPPISHDQNFKNLILDYPVQAIQLFSSQESETIAHASIVPLRQEQLKERLGDRLCLSLMSWRQDQKLEVYARAVSGLSALEPDPEKQLKYLDFVDIYTALDNNEMEMYQQKYQKESATMATLSERLRAEGMEKGLEEGLEKGLEEGLEKGLKRGLRQGEAVALRKLIGLKFGVLPEWAENTIQNASTAEIEVWLERVLTAEKLEALFD